MLGKLSFFTCSLLLTSLAAGCSSESSSPQHVDTVSLKATVAGRTLANARAVAIASNGMKYWAALDRSGQFTLKLPAGRSYRVLLVNGVDATTSRVSGHLVTATSSGAQRWIGLDGSLAVVDLGTLSPQAAPTNGGLTTKSDDEIETGGDGTEADDGHGDDPETHEGDDEGKACSDHDGIDKDGDVSDDDDVELHPSLQPGDSCKDANAKEHEDAEGHDHEDEDDHACGSPGGGAASDNETAASP